MTVVVVVVEHGDAVISNVHNQDKNQTVHARAITERQRGTAFALMLLLLLLWCKCHMYRVAAGDGVFVHTEWK